MNETKNEELYEKDTKVPWTGYFVLVLAILIFSGLFAQSQGWLNILDFDTLNGKFGTMKNPEKATFAGSGGVGAKAGFLFAFGLVPGVMLAMGMIEVIDYYGGLKAAQKMLTPILRPILGLPGNTGLALISSLQSTDAGAGMTKGLYESKMINEDERLIFAAFQFTAGGTITNYVTTGSALFSFIVVPIMWPLVVLFIMKIFGANVVRLYCQFVAKKTQAKDI